MRGWMVLALCCAPAWPMHYTSARTGNWSDPGVWSPAGIPGNGDTVSIANSHTVSVDQDAAIGTSVNGYFSYVSSVTIVDGGSGLSGACTAVFTGGTANYGNQPLSCSFTDGKLTRLELASEPTRRPYRTFYAAASAQPALEVRCGGVACNPQPNVSVAWQQGSGVAAIRLNASGNIVIGAGRTLTVRGTILYTGGGSNTTDGIVYQPGGRLVFDSSEAADVGDGTRPIYTYGQSSSDYGLRAINGLACTADQRCGLGSTNGYAQLGAHSFAHSGPNIKLRYTDIENLGNANLPAIDFMTLVSASIGIDVEGSRFVGCGSIYSAFLQRGTNTLRFVRNTWSGTKAEAIFALNGSGWEAATSGVRLMQGNVFDVALNKGGNWLSAYRGFTIEDNYFGGFPGFSNTTTDFWSTFRRNLVRVGPPFAASNIQVNISADVQDSYMLIDFVTGNPHTLGIGTRAAAITVDGWIFGYSDKYSLDSGEALVFNNPASVAQRYLKNSIFLPAADGHHWTETTCVLNPGNSNVRFNAEHNTWFGGAFGMVQTNEDGANATGQIPSMQSNIVWNPRFAGYVPATGPLKLNTVRVTGLNPDICTVCDYNLGWNHIDTQGNCTTGCPNQGNGYAGNWTVTPGAHDLNADPRFVDWQRTVELFDSKYLGNSYGAWTPEGAYAYGDFVTSTDAEVYWGLPVNYRCIAAGGCTGALKPGVPGTVWRDSWEWASLYRLRENLGAGYKVFPVDGAVAAAKPSSCTADTNNILCVMMAWVRQGYTPLNSRLYRAGHDGRDMGAVQMPLRRVFWPLEF